MITDFFHSSLLLLFLDPGSGMGKNQDSGSGINIPDPQHCIQQWKFQSSSWMPYNNGNVNHPAGCHITMSINQLTLPYNSHSARWLCHTTMEMSVFQLTLPYNNGNVNHPAGSAIQCKGQLSSREHPALQNMKFLTFSSTFVGHFCPP